MSDQLDESGAIVVVVSVSVERDRLACQMEEYLSILGKLTVSMTDDATGQCDVYGARGGIHTAACGFGYLRDVMLEDLKRMHARLKAHDQEILEQNMGECGDVTKVSC